MPGNPQSYEDAFLTKDARLFIGGLVTGDSNEEAAAIALGAAADLVAAIGATDGVGTENGWTELSTGGWGFVFGSYPGPASEIIEHEGAAEAVYRQDLGVIDLSWSFQNYVNDETIKVLGKLGRAKRRRLIVAPNGIAAGRRIDQFVAWCSVPTQDARGLQQFNTTASLNGPVTTHTLT